MDLELEMRDRKNLMRIKLSAITTRLVRDARVFILMALAISGLYAKAATAGSIFIVPGKIDGPHKAVANVLVSRLNSEFRERITVKELAPQFISRLKTVADEKDYIVTIGSQAFSSVLDLDLDVKLVATLIPRETYLALLESHPGSRNRTTAVFIEQPVKRNLELIRIAMPGRKPGILLGSQSGFLENRLRRAARDLSLPIYIKRLKPKENLVDALDQVLKNCSVLLAFADPEVSNPGTARHLLLTTYRYGIPMVAYSKAYVRAGALIAVYSTPEQFGQQTAELLIRSTRATGPTLPGPEFPRYFSVDINRNVARSLGIDLKPRSEIEAHLRSIDRASDE